MPGAYFGHIHLLQSSLLNCNSASCSSYNCIIVFNAGDHFVVIVRFLTSAFSYLNTEHNLY